MISLEELDPNLQAACELFAEEYYHYSSREGASGYCGCAADEFFSFLLNIFPEIFEKEDLNSDTYEYEVHFVPRERLHREKCFSNIWDSIPVFDYHSPDHSIYH